VRIIVYAALALSALALAGCSGDGEPVWEGPPEAASDGTVSTQAFTDYQEDAEADWERSPAMAAAVFLRLHERTASRTTIEAEAGPEGGGDQTVVVTLDGLADDSVRSERWTLGFEPSDDGVYALTGARRELRCHEGRGHPDFAAEACT
jgi:hypothetical protein